MLYLDINGNGHVKIEIEDYSMILFLFCDLDQNNKFGKV